MEHRNFELRIKVQRRFKSTNKAWLNLLASLTLYYHFTGQLKKRRINLCNAKFTLNFDWKRRKNRIWIDIKPRSAYSVPDTRGPQHRTVPVPTVWGRELPGSGLGRGRGHPRTSIFGNFRDEDGEDFDVLRRPARYYTLFNFDEVFSFIRIKF